MSKKKSTTETETTLTIVPAITAEMGIKSEDLIAVAVARRERALTAAMHRATREIRDIQKEIEKSRHAMELALKAATAVAVAERVAVLKAAFASLTDSTSVSYVGCKTSMGYTALVTISCKNFNGHNNSIAFEVEVTATDSLLEIEDLVKDLEVQLRKKMEELYALKGELNNIASTERQARAALAEATLRGTAQGRELLEAMTQMAGLMEVPQIGMTLNDEVK
jgi:hypothetical protein